ncbi:AAA domain-containing protein [Clostridium saccharoperbutylacetonicum]|uniref:AAA domain-containing protein n=1 Tax=Clostridium saccharoperbutylacetonicum TaxID=36745 RepID=UPI0039E821F8
MKENTNAIQERKIDIAYKIVEFWHIIEFLNQESFPENTKDNGKKVELVKKEQEGRLIKCKKERHINMFTLFYNFPFELEISEIIERDNTFFKKYPLYSSAIHLCIGKIKKEILIKSLYECLNLHDDRPEEDISEVCLIGLKVNKDGMYEKDSFRISPLVWGIYKCYESGGKIDGIISNKNYYNDIKLFEEEINTTESLKKEDIEKLYKSVIEKYIKPISDEWMKLKMKCSFIYTRYDSEKTFEREDDKVVDVSELIKGFYTDDLELVKEYIKYNNNSRMYTDIIDYIVSAYYEQLNCDISINDGWRIDIRNNKSEIEKWLHADKAPYGKWPSKFNPALMQQIAINIGVSEEDEVRNIFSVNGPPGTGKTTLLKEIIASNIVKRAELLCKYEKADDAFEIRYFEHGTFSNNGYDKYCNKYYVFKDENLSDFSMLVASCNNAAVENITKELPDEKALIKSLKANNGDSNDTANGLKEISDLFDTSKNANTEIYKIFDKNEEGKSEVKFIEKKDVYFSWLAYKLIAGSDEVESSLDINKWGLISAPMGNSSNIGMYCYNVLNQVIESFYYINKLMEKRHERYVIAKKDFKNQLLRVESINKELSKISRLSEEYKVKEKRNIIAMESIQEEINSLKNAIQTHLKDIESFKSKKKETINLISDVKHDELKLLEELNADEKELQNVKKMVEEVQENIIKKEDARKWYEIIFGRWIQTQRLSQIVSLKEELDAIGKQMKILIDKVEKNHDKHSKILELKDKYEKLVTEIYNKIESEKKIISDFENMIKRDNETLQNIKNTILDERKELQDILNHHGKSMVVIDDEFWRKFESKDENTSISIQISNPWITEEYNREREKLFYLALQLHKEFILSSHACRDNFKNLLMMWKFRQNYNNELSIYSKTDREKSYKHLINTLFLLTPVMSTTFASVGRFLGNIKELGSLGVLIIDEAGQAAPHMALGALWRCKKAIVVGDPKQVEPVVTDDANAIKRAFADKTILPYIDKTISVQGFADKLNNFGSYIKDTVNEDAPPIWIGCPLVVHRRCINPMFNISNDLSYGKTMKMQTEKAKKEDEDKFIFKKSCWINVGGNESYRRNHFIEEQGKKALEIISASFKNYDGIPDLYVISPFTTVVNGIKAMINQSEELRKYKKDVETWIENCCGTVHKFQGKEAKEVIFILGCDEKAGGAVRWVKPNIVNVAATRAQYRLYIIGDYRVWNKSKIFQITKNIIDNY